MSKVESPAETPSKPLHNNFVSS